MPRKRVAYGQDFGRAHPGADSGRKTKKHNMKKGITIIGILVAIGAAVVFWFGGFQSGKGNTDKPEWPEKVELGAVPPRLAEWRVLVIWEKAPSHAREGADVAGPFPYIINSKTVPTLAQLKDFNLSPPLPDGVWSIKALFDVELLRDNSPPEPEKPIEQPTKPK